MKDPFWRIGHFRHWISYLLSRIQLTTNCHKIKKQLTYTNISILIFLYHFALDTPCPQPASPPAVTCPTCPTIQKQTGILTTASATATTSAPKTNENVRLPRDFLPTNYDVMITPEMYSGDPSAFTFHGHVKITLNCKNAASSLRLHANILTVSLLTYFFLVVSKSIILYFPTLCQQH